MVPVTLFYGGLLGLLMAVLSIRVPMRRGSLNAPWGDAGDDVLATRIRVFGNFIEYVPAILLLMGLAEIQGLGPQRLHLAGAALVAARLVHAVSLRAGEYPLWRRIGRAIGAMLTCLILVALSISALWSALS